MTPPPEVLLGAADLWRPASRGGGWATAAALLFLIVSHLAVLLLHRRLRLRGGGGRITRTEAVAPAPAPGSLSGIEGLVTEDDLRQLVSSLGVGAREPEKEGWEHVIIRGNDAVSYRTWCDKPTDGPPKYLSITTYERCSTELLRDFYMDNEYRMEWDNTVTKHEQLQYDENSGVEVGRTIKKFPLLTPREYILAWRVWEANEKSFYCFIKECEHPLAARQRKFVRVRLLRSGWCIRKVPGRDACQITVLHHEDNGMNIEMAKLAFSKGIWSYICKMNDALRRYPRHQSSSISIQTMQRLMKKFPQDLGDCHGCKSWTTTGYNSSFYRDCQNFTMQATREEVLSANDCKRASAGWKHRLSVSRPIQPRGSARDGFLLEEGIQARERVRLIDIEGKNRCDSI